MDNKWSQTQMQDFIIRDQVKKDLKVACAGNDKKKTEKTNFQNPAYTQKATDH